MHYMLQYDTIADEKERERTATHPCASQCVALMANWLAAANLTADTRCMTYSLGMP